jgi:hypothetical protein
MLLNLLVQHLEQATSSASLPPAAAAAAGGFGNSTGPLSSTGSYLAGNSTGSYFAGNSTSIPGSSSGSWLLLLLPGWVPGPGSPYWGFVLAGLLGLSALAKAIIGSHYSYGLSMVTVRYVRHAITVTGCSCCGCSCTEPRVVMDC